jgi:hypothetical protein
VQPYVGPLGHQSARKAGRSTPLGFGGQNADRFAQLVRLDPSHDADRTQVMTMQFFCETPEDRVFGIGGNALDDDLSASHAERKRRTVFEQMPGPTQYSINRRSEGWVTVRVHRMPLERDRQ